MMVAFGQPVQSNCIEPVVPSGELPVFDPVEPPLFPACFLQAQKDESKVCHEWELNEYRVDFIEYAEALRNMIELTLDYEARVSGYAVEVAAYAKCKVEAAHVPLH